MAQELEARQPHRFAGLAHRDRHELVDERLLPSEIDLAEAHRAADDAAQHRVALLVAGPGAVGDREGRHAQVVRNHPKADVVHVNEIRGGAGVAAHLLEFDSLHGRWRQPLGAAGDDAILVGKRRIGFSAAALPDDVPWGDLGCDLVLECTGKFLKPDQLQGYFDRGVRRVIVAAPVKDPAALNIVVGVNDDRYDPAEHCLLTAASCTTNCLAPVVKVVHDAIGIRHGQITTIHDPTNTNVVVDAPHRDLRRARSAMLSLQPTTTGSATAIALIYPELKGRLNGHAVRAPVLNASLTDCVFELERGATEGEVNALFQSSAAGPLAGILGFEARPLVSADYANDTRSAIVDGPSTMVTDGTLLKIYAWYDNEVGYACRMVDLANIVIERGV